MNDVCTYLIQLVGQIEEAEINAMSPLQVRVARAEAGPRSDAAGTQLAVCTDQSGLIGLLRHLHGLGVVFVSVRREDGV